METDSLNGILLISILLIGIALLVRREKKNSDDVNNSNNSRPRIPTEDTKHIEP